MSVNVPTMSSRKALSGPAAPVGIEYAEYHRRTSDIRGFLINCRIVPTFIVYGHLMFYAPKRIHICVLCGMMGVYIILMMIILTIMVL